MASHPLSNSPHIKLYQCMHNFSSLHYTAVAEPTNVTVTPGENSISLEWSPPSEGSPLSYTVTWTGRGVSSNHVLPPTAHNYTIRGLDSNTAYSGTVQVSDNTTSATVPWNEYTLPQGELVPQSSEFQIRHVIQALHSLFNFCYYTHSALALTLLFSCVIMVRG